MKAIVMSDSHKNFDSILRIMDKEPDANLLIHAGDVQQDVDDMESVFPTMPIAHVLGNNDYFVHGVPDQRFFSFGGKQIFLTHGHTYGVKYGLEAVIRKAESMGADICIFGHTHRPYLEKVRNLWVLNPGSTYSSYATIEIKDGKIEILLKDN